MGTVICGLLEISKISSAYRNILCSCWPAITPLIFGLLRIAIANGSKTNAKMRGERGHPCLVPLCNSNRDDTMPLHNTDAWGPVYSNLTHLVNIFLLSTIFYFHFFYKQHNIISKIKQNKTADTYSTSKSSIKREGEREGQQEHKSHSFK